MTPAERAERFGVALLGSRLSKLGAEAHGGSEVVLWEDVEILRAAGLAVRVYARGAFEGAPVTVIPMRTSARLISSLEYAGQFVRDERNSLLVSYNEPTVALLAPRRTIVRFDWTTPLPRYWSWPVCAERFRAARYVFPSQSQRQLFLDDHPGIPKRNAIAIANAVNLELFRPADDRRIHHRDGRLRVGFAGQWVPGKGINELLEAWDVVQAEMPDAELLLAGGPALWKNVDGVAQADECGERVRQAESQGRLRCVGAIPRNRMPEFWNSMDVMVMPSLCESFGLVVLEAMACGIPVVSTSAGGLKEIVVDGETGLLVPPGDAHALSVALRKMLADESLRRRLARGALRRAQAFSLERRSIELLQLVLGTLRTPASADHADEPLAVRT